jgi:nucleoside-diphosphate-sugar epimerase
MFHALYESPVVIARPFMTYGPGQDPRKIIPYVTTSLLEGKAPRLSNGALEADFVYIDDVIDGLVAMVDAPELEGITMDLGSGYLTSVRSIVEHLLSLTGVDIEPMFGTLPDRPKEQVRIANIRQTALCLNWKPTVSLVQGLQQTVAWFKLQRTKSRAAVCPA